MLNKSNRLRKRYQFAYVYKNGSYVSSKAITIYFSPSKTKSIKIGFAVGKNVGHAITRNLIRRRLREIIRPQITNLKQQYNLIVYAKDSVNDFSFEELDSQLASLLKKANLYSDEKNS